MPPSRPSVATPSRPAEPSERTTLPSWLISMLLHLGLMLILGLTLRLTPPRGAAAERTAEVGIVLKHQEGDQPYYESEEDAGGGTSAAVGTRAGSADASSLFDQQPPSDPSTLLPSSLNVIGPGALEGGGVPGAGDAADGPRGSGQGLGRKFRTKVFGIEGEGHKVVYVFDRSESMEWRNALGAAKVQLLASLDSLDTVHQFQIVFFNDVPRIVPTRAPGQLVFGTEQNKTDARRFVGSIVPDGGTNRERALLLAISLQPDVIFFLTDADDPMHPQQLEKIHHRAAGITIHAVEFGPGPQSQSENFLTRLARDNGGKHQYVDISTLSPIRRP